MKKLRWLMVLGIVGFLGIRAHADGNIERYTVRGVEKYKLDKSGNISQAGWEVVSGSATITGDTGIAGKRINTRTTSVATATGTVIVPTSTFYVLLTTAGASAVQWGALPTISTTTAIDGQYLIIKGTSSVSTITLVDNGTLAGSLLELGASTRIISDLKVLKLMFDSVAGKWIELSYGNN